MKKETRENGGGWGKKKGKEKKQQMIQGKLLSRQEANPKYLEWKSRHADF